MKKVVLLFILFVFSLSQADAQEFHFIPRIGLNLANTYPESFADKIGRASCRERVSSPV